MMTIKSQFYVDLFGLDPITRKDLGFEILVEVEPIERKKYRTLVPAMQNDPLDKLIEAVTEEAHAKNLKINKVTVLGCQPKKTKRHGKRK